MYRIFNLDLSYYSMRSNDLDVNSATLSMMHKNIFYSRTGATLVGKTIEPLILNARVSKSRHTRRSSQERQK